MSAPFTFQPAEIVLWGSMFSTSLPPLAVIWIFDSSHSTGCHEKEFGNGKTYERLFYWFRQGSMTAWSAVAVEQIDKNRPKSESYPWFLAQLASMPNWCAWPINSPSLRFLGYVYSTLLSTVTSFTSCRHPSMRLLHRFPHWLLSFDSCPTSVYFGSQSDFSKIMFGSYCFLD